MSPTNFLEVLFFITYIVSLVIPPVCSAKTINCIKLAGEKTYFNPVGTCCPVVDYKIKDICFVTEQPGLPNRIHYTIRLPLWSIDSPKTASTWDTQEIYRTPDDGPSNYLYRNCFFGHFSKNFSSYLTNIRQQNCISVACVPPACCPYIPACTARGAASGPGGCIPTCNGVDPRPP